MIDILPQDQLDRVLNNKYCDIDTSFLGFTDVYKHLSAIIPQHYTVIDFGCAYNPQCYFFQNHKKYIAVDISPCEKFKSKNCEIYICSISDWIINYSNDYDMDETFAICNYVPPWGDDNCALVRQAFKNVYCFYPSHKKLESDIADKFKKIRSKKNGK